ncbi:MAG: nuclear transport factor 2 family protein, partial [Gammaproteobacteria bacterium]|nr:nuclear transport factor 2 family protein [Gammaproteobacteria bacterium]
HELADGREDGGDRLVMSGELLLDARLKLIDPVGKFLVRGEELAQLGRVVGGGLVQEGVAVSGGMIYEWGHGWLAFQKDGKRQVSSGPYFTVWRRNPGGSWQILRNLVLWSIGKSRLRLFSLGPRSFGDSAGGGRGGQ